MFPGRVAAVVKGMKDSKKYTKKNIQEQELKLLKLKNVKSFQDKDLYEISKTYMRFRHYPYAFWFLGFSFLAGAVLVLTLLFEDFFHLKKAWHEYAMVLGMIAMGVLFLTTGKVKSVIFDLSEKEILIRKRTLTCHCKTITKYQMSDLCDVRAVWRGIHTSAINTLHYSIILEFDIDRIVHREQQALRARNTRAEQKTTGKSGSVEADFDEDASDENAYLTSDAEQEIINFAVNEAQYEDY